VLLLICLGCAAQSASPDATQRIERKVRAYYNIPPQVKILIGDLKASEFPNYSALQITFDSGTKKQSFDFLLSKDNKTLVRWTPLDISKDPYAEVMGKINTAGRPVRGDKNAKVVAVNYDDFECPYCSHMHQTLFPELLKEYGDRVAFVYKDFPLVEIHPWATHAAVDANCLAAESPEAYWDFADYIHANQREVNAEKDRQKQFGIIDNLTLLQGQKHSVDAAKLQACVKAQNDSEVKASMKEGESLGVSATPTLFVNGQELDGALPIEELRQVLDRALTQAGVPVPVHPPASPAESRPSGQ
jgi:protein-disulfide isomerase